MIDPEVADLVERNAFTYGPVETALRVLRRTRAGPDPLAAWDELIRRCPRMAPLGYWRAATTRGGPGLDALEADCRRRLDLLVDHLHRRIEPYDRVLVVGEDVEVDLLWRRDRPDRRYRYLLLDGPLGAEPPGTWSRKRFRRVPVRVEAPFDYSQVEDALDWAEVLLLAGFTLHRQNLLGPPQLRPLLAAARDQVDEVLLAVVNERRLTLGEGAPSEYRDDFRPYLWQSAVTGLISEWLQGSEGTSLGWLPMPAEQLRLRYGEELFPS